MDNDNTMLPAAEPFLKQVADYYIAKGADMSGLTMVFPNRRSAMFMRKYLREGLGTVAFMPRLVSITWFIQQYCDTPLASDIELMFILYNAYCEVLRRHGRADQVRDFDAFIFWGRVLLTDFNDADADMVDTAQLFSNVKNYKELKSNYLTPAQKEVAEELLGYSFEYDFETFWQHMETVEANVGGKPDSIHSKFLSLWELMAEIHDTFVAFLDKNKPTTLIYSGLQSRRACEAICELGIDDFAGRRFAFVGFNIQPASRLKIFRHLKKLGVADFFWDTSSPLLDTEVDDIRKGVNRGALFIRRLARRFPMPDDFEEAVVETRPEIHIVGVPSAIAQTKVAARILNQLKDRGMLDAADAVRTAVVLCDTSLLSPMLSSVPADIAPVNVTMGLPLHITPFAALLSAIIVMQLRARRMRGDEGLAYYFMDVDEVLSHPLVVNIAAAEALAIKKEIGEKKIFNVPAAMLCSQWPDMAFLFNAVEDPKDIRGIGGYLLGILDVLAERMRLVAMEAAKGDKIPDFYEIKQLEAFREQVVQICTLAEEQRITMTESTFLTMVDRVLRSLVVQFSGKPLVGLQLMDMNDTRALDFENIIILSMNENDYPKRNHQASLIPPALRSGYGMPTAERQESADAYMFYRLLGRARRVFLLYDNRVGDMGSGEMSRYLFQLAHIECEAKVEQHAVSLQASVSSQRDIVVEKTPPVLAELQRFLKGGDRNLSASKLKSYLRCPLYFYLKEIKRLSGETKVEEFIDSATFGTAMHSLMEALLSGYVGKLVDAEAINTILNQDIKELALRILNEQFYCERYSRGGTVDKRRIPGEARVLAEIMARYAREILKAERAAGAFIVESLEVNEHGRHWQVTPDLCINFTFIIDRVDRLDAETLRFIDYKTGDEKIAVDDIRSVFSEDKTDGIFQLMLYALAYRDIYHWSGRIKPMLYTMRSIPVEGLPNLSIKSGRTSYDVESYDMPDPGSEDGKTLAETFEQELQTMLTELFSADVPFKQCDDESRCFVCPFKQLCGRNPKSDFK